MAEVGVAWLDDRDLNYIVNHGTFIPRSEIELNGYTTTLRYRFDNRRDEHLMLLAASNGHMGAEAVVRIYDYQYRKMQRAHYLLSNRLASGWEIIVNRLRITEEWWRRAGE